MVAILVAFRWSNYRSVATVEVALPEVATALINQDMTASPEVMADLRISYLQQKVLSTGSLVEIITKFNLYADARSRRPIADIAQSMLNDIRVDLLSSSASGENRHQIARRLRFMISFDYGEPLLAQQVTNEIVSRFLDEDIKQRQSQAKETTAFLASQIKTLESSLAEQERKMADFHTQYGDTRPDALAFNQSAMTSLMMNMQNFGRAAFFKYGIPWRASSAIGRYRSVFTRDWGRQVRRRRHRSSFAPQRPNMLRYPLNTALSTRCYQGQATGRVLDPTNRWTQPESCDDRRCRAA